MTRPLWPYYVTIAVCVLLVGYLQGDQERAEAHERDQKRVAQVCHRLGRTVAEDRDGKFTCEDLAPSWAMRSHIQIAEEIRSMK